MDGVETGVGEQQSVRVGQSDVFGGEDDEPAGNEFGVFPGIEHAGEVVDGGVRVAAAYAFDESGDDVVVHLSVLVVGGDVLLQGVGYGAVVYHQVAVRGSRDNVENVEQLAGVASRETEERARFAYLDVPFTEYRIRREGAVEQFLQLCVVHRLQYIDLTA